MEYTFFFEERTPFFRLRAYANEYEVEKDHGVTNGSDWSWHRWYEGILVFEVDDKKYIFFFKTFEVRDEDLPEFTSQSLFGTDLANREILLLCQEKAQQSEKSPFPFVEIGIDFSLFLHQKSNAHIRTPRTGVGLI
jgi:hypothetical protein